MKVAHVTWMNMLSDHPPPLLVLFKCHICLVVTIVMCFVFIIFCLVFTMYFFVYCCVNVLVVCFIIIIFILDIAISLLCVLLWCFVWNQTTYSEHFQNKECMFPSHLWQIRVFRSFLHTALQALVLPNTGKV